MVYQEESATEGKAIDGCNDFWLDFDFYAYRVSVGGIFELGVVGGWNGGRRGSGCSRWRYWFSFDPRGGLRIFDTVRHNVHIVDVGYMGNSAGS
jgi:hypothetical protein